MSRRKLENRNIRKLSKNGPTYFVTLPIEGIRNLGWKKFQKLEIEVDEKKERIIVTDWKK